MDTEFIKLKIKHNEKLMKEKLNLTLQRQRELFAKNYELNEILTHYITEKEND